jgi:hypothetical protein
MVNLIMDVVTGIVFKVLTILLLPLAGFLLAPILKKYTMLKYFTRYKNSYKALSRDLKKYVRPSILLRHRKERRESSYRELIRSVRSRKDLHHFWVVTGSAGFGKSTLMEQIFYRKSGNAISDRVSRKNIIYFNLADIPSLHELEENIKQEENVGKSTVLLLDAFDEFPYLSEFMEDYKIQSSYDVFTDMVTMLKRYVPSKISKVIISSRPEIFKDGVEDLLVYKVKSSYPPEYIKVFVLHKFDRKQTLKLYKKIGGSIRTVDGFVYKKGKHLSLMEEFLNLFDRDHSIFSIPFVILFADELFDNLAFDDLKQITSIQEVYDRLVDHWIYREYNKYIQQELQEDQELSFEDFQTLVMKFVKYLVLYMFHHKTTLVSTKVLEGYAEEHALKSIDFITIVARSFLRKTGTQDSLGRGQESQEYEFMHQTLYEYFLAQYLEGIPFPLKKSLFLEKKDTSLITMYLSWFMQQQDHKNLIDFKATMISYSFEDRTNDYPRTMNDYKALLFADRVHIKAVEPRVLLKYFPAVSSLVYKEFVIEGDNLLKLYEHRELDFEFIKSRDGRSFVPSKNKITNILAPIFFDLNESDKIRNLYDLSKVGVEKLDLTNQNIRVIKEALSYRLLDLRKNYVVDYDYLSDSTIKELFIDVSDKALLKILLENSKLSEVNAYLMDYYRIYDEEDPRFTNVLENDSISELNPNADQTIDLIAYLNELLKKGILPLKRLYLKWEINAYQHGIHIEKRAHDKPEIVLEYYRAYQFLKAYYRMHSSMMFYLLKTTYYAFNERNEVLLKEIFDELMYLEEVSKNQESKVHFLLFDIALCLAEYDVIYGTKIYGLDILDKLQSFQEKDVRLLKEKVNNARMLHYFSKGCIHNLETKTLEGLKTDIKAIVKDRLKSNEWDEAKLFKLLYIFTKNVGFIFDSRVEYRHRKNKENRNPIVSNYANFHFPEIAYSHYKYQCNPDIIFNEFHNDVPTDTEFYSLYVRNRLLADVVGLNDHLYSSLMRKLPKLKNVYTIKNIGALYNLKEIYDFALQVSTIHMADDTWLPSLLEEFRFFFETIGEELRNLLEEYGKKISSEREGVLEVLTEEGVSYIKK